MFSNKPQSIHEAILTAREAGPGDEGRLSAHAAECTDCAATLRTQEILRLHFEEALPVVPSPFVRETCAKAFATHRPSAPLWWVTVPASWRLGLAALFLLSALGGLAVGRGGTPPASRSALQRLALSLDAPELVALRSAEMPDSTRGAR